MSEPHNVCCNFAPEVAPLDYATAYKNRAWDRKVIGNVLQIYFLDVSDDEAENRLFVRKTASEWLTEVDARRAEIEAKDDTLAGYKLMLAFNFDQADPAKAHIRIKFSTTDASQTVAIGKAVQDLVVSPAPTMYLNLSSNPASPWRCNHVLHEFGHALGLVHEHQHPGLYKLDEDKVLEFYKAQKRVTVTNLHKFVTRDIVNRYNYSELAKPNGVTLDPESIMMYPLDPDWVVNTRVLAKYPIKYKIMDDPPQRLSTGDLVWMLRTYGQRLV